MFKSLQARILVPFLLLFLILGIISMAINRHYLTQIVTHHTDSQIDRLLRSLNNPDFLFNPIYIDKLKEVIDGDIVVLDTQAEAMLSTLAPEALSELKGKLIKTSIISKGDSIDFSVRHARITLKGMHVSVAAQYLPNIYQPEAPYLISLVMPLSRVETARARMTTLLAFVGSGCILLAAFFGFALSQVITRQVDQVVAVTNEIADGKFDKKVPPSPIRELQRLGNSINSMSAQLKSYEDQLIQTEQIAAASKITAAMAHEIRNPLSSIKMLSQLLRDRLRHSTEDLHLSSALLEEIGRIEIMVSDLLNMAKPSQANLQAKELAPLIQDIITVALPKLTHRKALLQWDPPDSEIIVRADPDKLKQVIWNLLLNAMDSMPNGGTIDIHLRCDEESGMAEIIIDDQGCGLSPESQHKLFIPFFTTKPEGIGLGLSTSKVIIEQHGGRLSIENRESGGVRAVFSVPLMPV